MNGRGTSGDRLIVLGNGTCQLDGRCASSVLVETGGLRLVFDFGRGVAERLGDLGLRQDDVEHVVLSHFHPDHISDLIPYLQAGCWSREDPRSRDLHVYGPPGLEAQMERLLTLFPPENLTRAGGFEVRLHEEGGDRLEIAGRRFAWADLPPAGNHGLGGDGPFSWALTGDSHFHRQELDFLRGRDLAIIDSGHLAEEEIVELAVESGVAVLVCSHLYRELDAPALLAAARKRGFRGTIRVAGELEEIPLSPNPSQAGGASS